MPISAQRQAFYQGYTFCVVPESGKLMMVPHFLMLLALYFAVGLRIGWTGSLLIVLIVSVIACGIALLFVVRESRWYLLHYAIVAVQSETAIQTGFVVGLLTAAWSKRSPLQASDKNIAWKSWVRSALEHINEKGLPVKVLHHMETIVNWLLGHRSDQNDKRLE